MPIYHVNILRGLNLSNTSPEIQPGSIIHQQSLIMNEQDNTETFPSPANEHLRESKTHVMQAADELRAAATDKAQQIRAAASDHAKDARTQAETTAERLKTAALDGKQRFSQFADDKMNVTKDRARHYHEESEQYIRENPSKAILTALGVGFVLGALFRR